MPTGDWQNGDWQNGDWRDGDWQDGSWPPPPDEVPRKRVHGSGTAVLAGLGIVLLTVLVGLGPSGIAGVVRDLRADDGAGYAFLMTQPGSDRPVTYDPCRVIEVTVNPDGAPRGYADLVATAIRHVAEPTGLDFTVVEETDERPRKNRPTEDPQRYGDGPSPVLVAWSTPDEIPELEGRVAGVGGSTAVTVLGARSAYVTGSVVLDRELFRDLVSDRDGRAEAQAIMDHEFGHLVGLDHVKNRGELMNATNSGQLDWGPGDLAGLALLGQGRCEG